MAANLMVKAVCPEIRGFPISVDPNFSWEFAYISVEDEGSGFKFGKFRLLTKSHCEITLVMKMVEALG